MAEYGQPTRSATKDANAGVVNPPAKRSVARDTAGTSNKQLSGSGKVFESLDKSLSNPLGAALTSMLTEETSNINSRKRLDAARRQGVGTAVNEIDEVKKHTGWEKAIFGEDVAYREAQQRAVTNQVQASYISTLAEIDTHAGETPEQFHKLLQDKNDAALEQYKNDPGTSMLVEKELMKANEKLASSHQKSHYAYNQMQQQETVRIQKKQTIDSFTLEGPQLLTKETKLKQVKAIERMFKGGDKPTGMSNLADRTQTMDIVIEHMTAGNSGAMQAVKALGLDKNFSPAEQQKWDRGIAAYDKKFGQKASTIRINADTQMAAALTPDEVDRVVNQKQSDLDELFKRSSGSQQSSLVMARGNLDVAQDEKSLRKQATNRDDALKKAQADATTAEDKAILGNMGIANENMKQAIAVATTPEEKQAAIDAYNATIGEQVQGLTPTTANILKKEKLDTQRGMAEKALLKEQSKAREAAHMKKLELAETKVRTDGVAEYFSSDTLPAQKAALQQMHGFTTKEKAEGLDVSLIEGSQAFLGGDSLPTAQEFTKELQTNPQLQAWVLQRVQSAPEVSPMLKSMLTHTTQSVDRLFDVDGNVSEVGLQTVQMVNKIMQSDKGIAMMGGADAHRQWKIASLAIESGAGQQAVERKITNYNANKDKQDAAGFNWKEHIGEQSRKQWMGGRLKKLGIPNPSSQMIVDELHNWRQDMKAYADDSKEADNSMFQRVQNGKTKVFNSNLSNAKAVNDATKWGAEDFIKNAERYNLLTPKYSNFRSKESDPMIRKQSDIPNLRWYTKPGEDGLFATGPSYNEELQITVEEMQDMETLILEKDAIDKAARESKGRVAFRAYEAEREMLRITQPLLGY